MMTINNHNSILALKNGKFSRGRALQMQMTSGKIREYECHWSADKQRNSSRRLVSCFETSRTAAAGLRCTLICVYGTHRQRYSRWSINCRFTLAGNGTEKWHYVDGIHEGNHVIPNTTETVEGSRPDRWMPETSRLQDFICKKIYWHCIVTIHNVCGGDPKSELTFDTFDTRAIMQ